ncbi:MAG: PLP-dependent aminotransferase family protein [Cyanobacteria bacterium J06632_22]
MFLDQSNFEVYPLDLVLTLDSHMESPLHQQVYGQLRQAILTGRLQANQRLPATRSLAQSLGVSRTTVIQGYDQLISEGYLETRVGAGTYVCSELPELALQVELPDMAAPKWKDIRLSTYAERVQQIPQRRVAPRLEIDFRYGTPALDLFPMGLWRQLLARQVASTDVLGYAPSAMGDESLRGAIATHIRQARGVRCQPAQILITGGSQQALDLIARLVLHVGDRMAFEEPGYAGARQIFTASGAEIIPIPIDGDGIDLDRVKASHPRLVYVTPSHQFPTGTLLSLPRRLALLQWAADNSAMIIEDDYDSEYRYGGRPIPALQGLDGGSRVFYIGTFSKVMFPGLRMGYLVVPKPLITVFKTAKWLADRQPPALDQRALCEFIEAGHLERHLRKMRICYARRRQALVDALNQQFGQAVQVLGDQAGLHIMVRWTTQLSDDELVAKAAAHGVGIYSARRQYLSPERTGEFVFGYAELDERSIKEGIRRIAEALKPA